VGETYWLKEEKMEDEYQTQEHWGAINQLGKISRSLSTQTFAHIICGYLQQYACPRGTKLTRFLFCRCLQLEDIPGGNFKSFAPGIKKEELLSLQGMLALHFFLGSYR
jgi:hypothetical protein